MFFFLSLPELFSSEDVDIYQVEIPVADQSVGARAKAIKSGLNKVLIRASGRDSVLGNEYIQSNIKKANSFIQKFSYKALQSPVADNVLPWVIKLSFEPDAVKRLLADSGLPVWGKRRPAVLVWIAEQNHNQRQILSSDSEEAATVTGLAKDRGIPFSLPLMDLEDTNSLEMTDIWGRFTAPVEAASQRYGADVILFGRVYPSGDKQWQADWQFIMEKDGSKKRAGWSQQGESKTQIFNDLMAELGRRLCSQYCVMPTLAEENEMRVAVNNLSTFKQAIEAEQYLQNLLPVRTVNIELLSPQRVIFKLQLVSRQEDVLEAISLDNVLQTLPVNEALGTDTPLYNFSWVQ